MRAILIGAIVSAAMLPEVPAASERSQRAEAMPSYQLAQATKELDKKLLKDDGGHLTKVAQFKR